MTEAPQTPLETIVADVLRIETSRIEGSLRTIRDLAGMDGAQAAAHAALKRVCRAFMNDDDGWVT
jgi:hypothetical protein